MAVTLTNAGIFINMGTRPEQEQLMSITSVEQLDGLGTDAVVVIARPGQDAEEWKRRGDGKWTNIKARRAAISSRHFRGAIEGGILSRGTAGRGATAANEEYRWQVGDRWFLPTNERELIVIVTPNENEANNTLKLAGSDGIRRTRSTLQSLRDNGWRRVGAYQTPPNINNWAGLLDIGVTILMGLSPKEVPEALTEELRTYLLANPNADLLGIFAKHNIDLSVETGVKVEGTSEVKGDELAMVLGVDTKMTGTIATPWAAEFKTNVVPGCVCDMDWKDAIVDEQQFAMSIPEEYTDIKVDLTCPVHPDGKPE